MAFAGSLALLALLVTLIKDARVAWATTLAAVAAVWGQGLPFRLNIVVAVLVAVGAGLWLERRATSGAVR